jgi:hypothetical protein
MLMKSLNTHDTAETTRIMINVFLSLLSFPSCIYVKGSFFVYSVEVIVAAQNLLCGVRSFFSSLVYCRYNKYQCKLELVPSAFCT